MILPTSFQLLERVDQVKKVVLRLVWVSRELKSPFFFCFWKAKERHVRQRRKGMGNDRSPGFASLGSVERQKHTESYMIWESFFVSHLFEIWMEALGGRYNCMYGFCFFQVAVYGRCCCCCCCCRCRGLECTEGEYVLN